MTWPAATHRNDGPVCLDCIYNHEAKMAILLSVEEAAKKFIESNPEMDACIVTIVPCPGEAIVSIFTTKTGQAFEGKKIPWKELARRIGSGNQATQILHDDLDRIIAAGGEPTIMSRADFVRLSDNLADIRQKFRDLLGAADRVRRMVFVSREDTVLTHALADLSALVEPHCPSNEPHVSQMASAQEPAIRCECDKNSMDNPNPKSNYEPKEYKAMRHLPGKCPGDYELRRYRRPDGTIKVFCSCCHRFGDVLIGEASQAVPDKTT